MKNQLYSAAACVVIFLFSGLYRADAQLPYAGSFKTSSQKGLVVSGIAKLTAATGQDPEGQGYLQLTDTGLNRVGYMYAEDSFPSNYGLTATFEFFIYKTGANSFNQADGICFFLFDASVATFRPGAFGGSLGYAQKNAIPGMSKGYIGIGVDEFGNFSAPLDGGKNGGPGQLRGSVTVRGPGNGLSATDYVFQKNVVTNSAPYNINFQGFTQRYPDSTSANYRRVKFILTPGSSLGTNLGYKVTVIMYRGGSGGVTAVELIKDMDYPFVAPAQLQYGMAASTGSNVDFHEIRNMDIRATNISALVAPTANADNITTCSGQPAIFDITTNDASNNAGGSINRESIDLDPVTAGVQTAFTDAGKGTYSIDANRNIMFMPATGFSGTSTITYTVKDSYGVTSPNGTINVTLSATEAPGLTITNPTAVCAPAVIDITSSTYRTGTTSGATFDYFATLSNAYNNTGSIATAAKTINTSGVYYIKTSANGCATVKPITVTVNQTPTAANAGLDQTVCTAVGATASVSTTGNTPETGTGTWTQVSGPAAAVVNPNSGITAINGLEKGTYVFRWTVANGACASSSDDVQIFSNVAPISNAGPNQNLANATTATLAANTPNVGTGVWSKPNTSTATITTPSSPTTTVTGLTVGNTYAFTWTVTSTGCSAASSVVNITSTSVVMANAGPDQSVSAVQSIALDGNAPATGQAGVWTVVSAPAGATPVFTNSADRLTTVTGINRIGDYTFKWTISNGQASTEDLVKITVLSILPIDLLSFTVKMQDGFAQLNWKTPLTNTNKRFTVQRSTDGTSFFNLSEVNDYKNIAGSSEYAYADKLNGSEGSKLYYRLRQVNQAGIVDYSNVLVLKLEGLLNAQFWPNPFSSRVSMKLNFMKPGTAQVRLMDSNGKLLRDYQEKVIAGNNFINIEGLNAITPGVYQVLISKDGITTTNKVVKQ
jgi:hypothetical protein